MAKSQWREVGVVTPAEHKNLTRLVGKRLVGKRVAIEWRNPKDDWSSFVLLEIDLSDATLRLRGTDMPDGAKHDGGKFWADWSDVRSIRGEKE